MSYRIFIARPVLCRSTDAVLGTDLGLYGTAETEGWAAVVEARAWDSVATGADEPDLYDPRVVVWGDDGRTVRPRTPRRRAADEAARMQRHTEHHGADIPF